MLLETIKAEIEQSPRQVLSFAEFMQIALYDPHAGYYSQHVNIGRSGDFVTAPELGNLFATALANQFIELQKKCSDTALNIFEFGAGHGTLATQILQILDAQACLPERYLILEVSGLLKERQRQAIATLPTHLQQRVEWCEQLPTQPLDAMVIANEVLDAMPVHQVVFQQGKWFEQGVVLDNEQLHWSQQPLSESLQTELEQVLPEDFEQMLQDPALPYVTEINLNYEPWLKSLYQCLNKGLCLLIDYGFVQSEYFAPARAMGTLMCHHQQKAHTDPFAFLGQQDITAHVDFSRIAELAHQQGFDVDGFCEQGQFILSLDVLESVSSYEQKQELKLLTLPHEMGSLFKVLALSKGVSDFWQGFTLQDKRGRL